MVSQMFTKRNSVIFGLFLGVIALVGYISSNKPANVPNAEMLAKQDSFQALGDASTCVKICDKYIAKEGRKDLIADCDNYCQGFDPKSAAQCTGECKDICDKLVPEKKQVCGTDCQSGCNEAYGPKFVGRDYRARSDNKKYVEICEGICEKIAKKDGLGQLAQNCVKDCSGRQPTSLGKCIGGCNALCASQNTKAPKECVPGCKEGCADGFGPGMM